MIQFCDKIPDKNPADQTEILAWKVSLQITANKSIDKLLSTSIEKGLISYEKELTMNFVRYIFVGKNTFGDTL